MINNLKEYKDFSLFYIINKLLKKIVGKDCNFFYVSSPGSSPSKVYMFKDTNNNMYAVKICKKNLSRVSLFQEEKNIEYLVPYLNNHLSKIIYTSKIDDLEIMVSECYGVDNLYTSLALNKKPLNYYYKIWNNVTQEIIKMWSLSKDSNYEPQKNPRNNTKRIKRIETNLYKIKYNNYLIKDLINLQTIINGVEYQSIAQTIKEIKKINNPEFGVTCHGDPQPSNIVVNDEKWYLVDWEWSGKNHDYRLMFSHLFGWWATRMTKLKNSPYFNVIDDKLIINYKIEKNKIIDKFQKIASNNIRKNFDLGKKDIDDINRFLSLLYLGDIRFLNIWEKNEFLPVLIGEAIKTINYIKNNDSIINCNFTYK